jgi:dihydrofolate reductase
MNKVILYIATSQDNFIADKNGGVDWLPSEPDPEDTVGFKELLNRIKIIVLGSTSYQQIIGFGPWAWPDKKTYVFTYEKLDAVHPSISFVQGCPQKFLTTLDATGEHGDIWLLGGANLAHAFAEKNLIDEYIVTIAPVTLDEGIKIDLPMGNFMRASEKLCVDGMIQKTYVKAH